MDMLLGRKHEMTVKCEATMHEIHAAVEQAFSELRWKPVLFSPTEHRAVTRANWITVGEEIRVEVGIAGWVRVVSVCRNPRVLVDYGANRSNVWALVQRLPRVLEHWA